MKKLINLITIVVFLWLEVITPMTYATWELDNTVEIPDETAMFSLVSNLENVPEVLDEFMISSWINFDNTVETLSGIDDEIDGFSGTEIMIDDMDSGASIIIDRNVINVDEELIVQNVEVGNNMGELTTFEKAFQEVAYAYYMRGSRIQYNSMKWNPSWFSPEEATTQNYSYLVCSAFAKNVYYDLLGIKIPGSTESLMDYTREHIGNPEVVGYGSKSGNNFIMTIYNSGTEIILTNPNLRDIIPYLRVGDVLTYNGHAVMVYDLDYDETGKIVDAVLIQAVHGVGWGYVKSKIPSTTRIGDSISFGSANHYLYYNSKKNTDFEYGLVEGSLNMMKITQESHWKNIGLGVDKDKEYSILRFVQEDEQGKLVLTYSGYTGEPFLLSNITEDRLKFSKLFIEKTVSEHADDMVALENSMEYTIIVKNNSNKDYTDDLIVTENISEFVTYSGYTSTKQGVEFNKNGSTLTWNIGRLTAGEKVTIKYSVDVNKGSIGDIIVSTGNVWNIPSAIIKNGIGKALNEEQEANIGNSYERLKSNYNGKELIDKVYEESLGVDLNLKEFDISNLIINTNLRSTNAETVYINQENLFSKMILNKYWNTLALIEYNYEDTPVYAYDLKFWELLSNIGRRADTVNLENFKTGDILIYTNTNDIIYSLSGNQIGEKPVTYENWEYAYIYIDGKFVWVNLGNDEQAGTLDDRNEFTTEYYNDNTLKFYSKNNISTFTDEWLQYQTLFGKDTYVILRPSLMIRSIDYELNWWINNTDNPRGFMIGSDGVLKEPTKSGYTFNGWYTDSGYTNQVNNISNLIDDVVLYAKRGKNSEYVINYKLNNGILSWENATRYTIESETITLTNPTKTGYTFVWWSGTDIDGVSFTVIIPKWSTWDRIYEANRNVNQYTITFNTDWGSYVPFITADYNSVITAPTNPTKNWYRFVKWEPEFPIIMPLDGSTLKAIWEKNWSNWGGWWGGWWGWWWGWTSTKNEISVASSAIITWEIISTTWNSISWIYEETSLERPDTLKLFEKDKENDVDKLRYEEWNQNEKLSNWYTREFNNAYKFAYMNGITTMKDISKAGMYWKLTRIAMAKMLSNYAVNVLWKKTVSSNIPVFSDVSNKLNGDYDWAVTLAYQLWIMWINMKDNKFRPYDTVTRAEFWTALSRLLYWTPDWSPYYVTHLDKLKREWIISNTKSNLQEKRWYVMLMLMRSVNNQ